MARTFVFNDNLTARVELISESDEDGDEFWTAFCAGCPTTGRPEVDDLLHETSERFALADAQQVAASHADSCKRCADPDCRNYSVHDRGHDCRSRSMVSNWPDPDARPTY
jgi:hypothetical protein